MKQNTLIAIILILLLPLIIALTAAQFFVFNEPYYLKQFEQTQIYDKVPENITRQTLTEIFDFFRGDRSYITFFNDEENAHIWDVRVVLEGLYIFYYISIFLFVFGLIWLWYKDRARIYRPFKYGGILTLVLIVLFIIFGIINFDLLFTLFHKLFFKEGSWIFDPASTTMVNIFAQQFFENIAGAIAKVTIIIAVFVLLIGLAIEKLFELKQGRHKRFY